MDSELSSKSDQPLKLVDQGNETKHSCSDTNSKRENEKGLGEHRTVRMDGASTGEFSDPIYKKLAKMNGEINKMTKDELKHRLVELKLDTNGVKEVLKRRLKNFYKKKKLMKARIKPMGSTRYDYLVVIDFEATCEKDVDNYQHEIIEFPAHLVDISQLDFVDSFHSYCKPVLNSQLTAFCTQLTGITQKQVGKAPEFEAVLASFCDWMSSHNLGTGNTYAIVTDGPWDMSRFLHMQCQQSDLPFPRWARKWVNIRKVYSNFYQTRRCGIEAMLTSLGMSFEGQLHCGLDDARNIARIALRLLGDGATFRVNEYLSGSTKSPRDRTYDVENVSPSNPVPADIRDDGDDQAEVADGNARRKNTKTTVDTDLCSGISRLKVTEETNDDGDGDGDDDVDDLLEYYRLQSA